MKRRELEARWVLRDVVAPLAGQELGRLLRGPDDLRAYAAPWALEPVETLYVVCVDARMRVIGHRLISRGDASSTAIPVAEVARAALLSGGVGFILVHNHPSGDPTASRDDIDGTHACRDALAVLTLPLLDHIIVATGLDGALVTTSMKEMGIL